MHRHSSHSWAIVLGWCAAVTLSAQAYGQARDTGSTSTAESSPVDRSSTAAGPVSASNSMQAWAGLEPVTLEHALELGRTRAPEVVVARAELEASRSAGVGARALPLLNPYVEVIAERGNRGVTQDIYITAQAHTPIEVAGQRGQRIAEADSFVEWHSAALEQVRAEIAGAVVRRYGECLAWAARYETLSTLLASAALEASVFVARRDAGDATERDAQLAEVDRARIAVQLEETHASLGAALSELSRLTGKRFGPPHTTHLFPQVDLRGEVAKHATEAPAVQSAAAEARFYSRQDERLGRERIPPLTLILQGGRGDYGETRLGAGLAWSLPAFRYNQGERARAQAESARSRTAAAAYKSSIAQRLNAIVDEGQRLRVAVERLDKEAIPAATLATESATRMQRAGKTDLLSVIVARRDQYVLRLRRLDIAERAWALLGDWVELSGRLP